MSDEVSPSEDPIHAPAAPERVPSIDLGEVLGSTFRILNKSFPKLFAIGLLLYVPYFAIEIMYPGFLDPDPALAESDPLRFVQGFASAMGLNAVLGQLLTATVCYEALQRLRGRRATIQRSLSVGLQRLFPVLMMLFVMFWPVLFAMFLLIFPAIMLMMRWWVAVPVCVIERRGIMECLKRSSELTRGNRWQVFAISIIGVLIGFSSAFPIGIAKEFVGDSAARQGLSIALVAVTAALAVFQGILVSVTYSELRTKKEGTTSDELLEIFS